MGPWERAWHETYNAALAGLYTNVALVSSKEGVETAHKLAQRAANRLHGENFGCR
jgi:hypothetical protein